MKSHFRPIFAQNFAFSNFLEIELVGASEACEASERVKRAISVRARKNISTIIVSVRESVTVNTKRAFSLSDKFFLQLDELYRLKIARITRLRQKKLSKKF